MDEWNIQTHTTHTSTRVCSLDKNRFYLWHDKILHVNEDDWVRSWVWVFDKIYKTVEEPVSTVWFSFPNFVNTSVALCLNHFVWIYANHNRNEQWMFDVSKYTHSAMEMERFLFVRKFVLFIRFYHNKRDTHHDEMWASMWIRWVSVNLKVARKTVFKASWWLDNNPLSFWNRLECKWFSRQ